MSNRVVGYIEKAFYAFIDTNIKHVSFKQLKDWINGNTRDGISSPRLGRLLRQNAQFKHVSKIRKVGSNMTETYWSLEDDVEAPEERGWVKVVKEADTGI